MKMYILIKETIPLGFAFTASAHASLACYLKYQEDEDMKEWVNGTFYKVVCKVSEQEFEQAKEVEGHVCLTESALEHQEVALAFKPRQEWPKSFRFFKLYR